MRKLLLFLCFLCSAWIARGQTELGWRYWFDSDMQSGKTGTATGRMFNIEAGTNALAPGAHTINIQVSDKDGVQSSPVSRLFYNQGSNTVNDFLYWFDGNAREMQTVTNADGHYDLDVSKLGTGIHFLNYMFRDASGKLTTIKHDCFYRIANTGVMKFSYWFDGDRASMQTVPLPRDVMMIDLSNLSEGFHTIHCMVSDNQTVSFETRMFLKVPKIEGNDVEMTCICTVDGKLVAQDKLPSSGGILNYNFDVNKLSVGLHKTVFQIIAPTGAASNIVERYFIRTTTNAEIGSMKCVYAIDDMKTYTQAGTMQNGLFHFDLDVATLVDGLHRLAYMLVSDDGTSTPLETAYFWKTPVGGPGIIQYDYWLNESDNIHTVKLKDRTNPLSLITLLPVEQEPIRSSCFHFEVKDNQPMIYAKNDFHIAFYDVTGRRLDESKQFVDYNVSQTVSDIAELQKTQTFAKVDENKIKWFKFHAEAGDSLAFNSDLASSLQVFSSSSEEVYSAKGASSVEIGGFHAKTDDTYYLAVHDVKGTSSNSMRLDFQLIDKYCVLRYDPSILGNPSGFNGAFNSFVMNLDGNGLDKLQDVKLINGTNALKVDHIEHQTKAKASVHFTIDNVPNGKYDMHLLFSENGADEQITMDEAFEIEEPKPEDVIVNVSHSYSPVNPVTLEISVTNSANIPYTFIPFNIAFDCIEKISKIEYKNFWVAVPKDADQLGYTNIIATKNLLGKGVKGCMMFMFIPYLQPHETKTFLLDMSFNYPGSPSGVYAWTGIPYELDPIYHNEHTELARKVRLQYNAEAARNMITAGETIQNLTGVEGVPAPVNAAGQAANMAAKTGVTLGGLSEALDHSVDRSTMDAYGIDPDSDLGHEIDGLHGQGLLSPGEIIGGTLGDLVDGLMGLHRGCAEQPDPSPTGMGGAAHQIAVDPNDIYGYISESGSKFIKESVNEVCYSIEFENDPEQASASAHVVEVTNVLDSKYFDLSTYAPTSIKIGNKTEMLDGSQNFVKTIDMRPEINAITQVEASFDETTGVSKWLFTSLDPMTMEPTNEIMQGFLPINFDGVSGIGEVAYNISLRQKFPDGTEIPNQASIVFDTNDPIETPVWINTVDAVAPTSTITSSEMLDGGMVRLNFDGEDARSGIWKYTLYAQYGAGTSWEKVAEVDTTCCDFQYYADMDYGFCVMATDSAGNVEQKEFKREYELQSFLRGDVNCDGKITISDAVGIVNFVIRANTTGLNGIAADANQDGNVSISDAVFVVNQVIRADQNHVKAEQKKEVNASLAVHSMKVTPGDCFELPVVLNGDPGCISALQLDLSLPDGLMLEDVGCDRSHNVSHAVQTDGKERIAVLSTDNAVFPGNGESVIVLYLKTAPDFVEGTVSIDDIELVTPSVTAIHPAMVNATIGTSDATAVDGIGDNAEQGDVYNMQGQRATKHSRGVVIQNKKKKIRK